MNNGCLGKVTKRERTTSKLYPLFYLQRKFFILSRPEHDHYTQYGGEALCLKVKGYYWYNGFPIIQVDWLDWRSVYNFAKPATKLSYDLRVKVEQSIFNAAGWVLDAGRQNVPMDVCHKIPSYTRVRQINFT